MKLDVLVLASHPDDAELGCGGTIIKHVNAGYKVGVVDFTEGELGTRGTVESRQKEAKASSQILGLSARINLGLPDGFFQDEESSQRKLIAAIRSFQPEIVLANAISDRHPDHARGANLAHSACFLSGLTKVETIDDQGKPQPAWRPKVIYHYIQSQWINPDVVIDVTASWDKKMEAVRAFKSQFFDPGNKEPVTYISTPEFLKLLEARAIEMGNAIGVRYGEGFVARRWIGAKSLFDLI